MMVLMMILTIAAMVAVSVMKDNNDDDDRYGCDDLFDVTMTIIIFVINIMTID